MPYFIDRIAEGLRDRSTDPEMSVGISTVYSRASVGGCQR